MTTYCPDSEWDTMLAQTRYSFNTKASRSLLPAPATTRAFTLSKGPSLTMKSVHVKPKVPTRSRAGARRRLEQKKIGIVLHAHDTPNNRSAAMNFDIKVF